MPEWKNFPSNKPADTGYYITKDFTRIPLICFWDLEKWFCNKIECDPRQVTAYCPIPSDNWKAFPAEKPIEDRYIVIKSRLRGHTSPWVVAKYLDNKFIADPGYVVRTGDYISWVYVPAE